MTRLSATQAVTLRYFTQYAELSALALEGLLVGPGYRVSRSALHARLHSYAQSGLLERLQYGRYRITDKGRAALARHEERLAARRAERAQAQALGGAA